MEQTVISALQSWVSKWQALGYMGDDKIHLKGEYQDEFAGGSICDLTSEGSGGFAYAYWQYDTTKEAKQISKEFHEILKQNNCWVEPGRNWLFNINSKDWFENYIFENYIIEESNDLSHLDEEHDILDRVLKT